MSIFALVVPEGMVKVISVRFRLPLQSASINSGDVKVLLPAVTRRNAFGPRDCAYPDNV